MMAVSQASTNERSLRSVFVGNIPYDASEEKLKDVFSEVGPVLSFKLVYDRESGKPKGYGFCEYRDQDTAMSAMRNLNGYEMNGRSLRVDTATNERFKEEIKNLQMASASSFESPYGQEVDPEKAPETIAKVVASLPPQQMYEIARQMKHCVLTNPNEARNMLLQNPQLAYALLQVLVMIRAIDVSAASAILYKPNPAPVTIPPGNVGPGPGLVQQPHPTMMMPPTHQPQQPQPMLPPMNQNMFESHDPFNRPPVPPQHQVFEQQRMVDPRLRQNDPRPNEIFDPRVNAPPPAPAPLDPRIRAQNMDPRHIPGPQAPPPTRGPAPSVPPSVPTSSAPLGKPSNAMFNPANFGRAVPNASQPTGQVNPTPGPLDAPNQIQSEQEKANLILQVLALSDEQIDMLPPESRESIRELKLKLMNHGQN